MVQMYRQCLCIEAAWLFESGIISEAGYRQAAHRGDIRVLRRGCRGVSALVDFESLPPRIKQSIREQIGNPYDHMETNILQAELQPIPAAADFYDQFTIDAAGRHLPAATARQYYAEACILTAIGSVIARLSGRARACGHRQTGVWDEMAAAIKAIDVVRWPHRLPSNPRSLERKFRAFRADGYAALIHGGFKNANAAKVTADADLTELLDLTSDPRNLPDTTVARIFNARHEAAPITPGVVARFRQAHEQEIYARRHGGSEFRANRLMTVKRSAPSAPLYLWVLDGWDAELLYQKTTTDKAGHNVTTYFNRVKLEVILDACTCYPIGFAIADTESPALVKAALRNALDHVRSLFGSRFRPAQIQMDHAGYKSLADLYAATAVHVTPAAVRNAKAKVIEPWFRRFNDAYCHLQPNWSGYGLTADKGRQPNAELINQFRHDFPDRDGVIRQLTSFIAAERARLHDEFLAKWEAMPPENRFPLSDEAFLLAYGERSERSYLLQNTGINFTLPASGGKKVAWDCFNHEFRRHASTRWTIVYDPNDTSRALALSPDESLRFLLEEKHVQPMALIERKEGDAAALQRVRDFNRAEEQRVTDALRDVGGPRPLAISAKAEPELNEVAARDYETLSKLLIVDSDGQHKQQKDLARMMRSAVPAPADTDVSDLY